MLTLLFKTIYQPFTKEYHLNKLVSYNKNGAINSHTFTYLKTYKVIFIITSLTLILNIFLLISNFRLLNLVSVIFLLSSILQSILNILPLRTSASKDEIKTNNYYNFISFFFRINKKYPKEISSVYTFRDKLKSISIKENPFHPTIYTEIFKEIEIFLANYENYFTKTTLNPTEIVRLNYVINFTQRAEIKFVQISDEQKLKNLLNTLKILNIGEDNKLF